MTDKSPKLYMRDICFISVFTAFTAVCAQIAVPMPVGVPFTLQTFAVPLAGIILGAKRGALSALVYILLGITGVPVFSGFRGGIGVIFGVTGGYIISFPVMALFAGISSDLFKRFESLWVRNTILAGGLVLGAAINYISGMLWGKFILDCNFAHAFNLLVLPYIPTSVIKIILAWGVGITVKKILVKNKLI